MQQANIYLLEHVVEKGLDDYDPKGAAEISNFVDRGIPVTTEYAFLIYQALHIDYTFEKAGKTRFRKIPQMLVEYFNSQSSKFKAFVASCQKSALEQRCEITDLEFRDFPEIKW
ncbi:hypothetical protein [Dyadobacter sp. 676]|uniref:Uncharacterized protein n=1 Tax=Dyadobacter sp. 676 TaxID=3088362 RepID=A0AAU8FLA8_9BACT